jgi:hypothetical protein
MTRSRPWMCNATVAIRLKNGQHTIHSEPLHLNCLRKP